MFRKILIAIALSTLAPICFAQTARMERLFEIPGSKYPEVMVRWTLEGGCFHYRTIRSDFVTDLEEYKQLYEWSGECIEGEPLNGPGELLGLSINFQDEHVPDDDPAIGRMVNGRWEGTVRKGENSYTYRNGCMSENPCRKLFDQLDASLGIGPQTASVNAGTTSGFAAATPSSARLTAQECDARKRAVIATNVASDASITASQETVMFLNKTTLEMIDGGCPTEPGVTQAQIAAERQLRQEQYVAAERACNAVQSGGRPCVAQNHFGPGARSHGSMPTPTGETSGTTSSQNSAPREQPKL